MARTSKKGKGEMPQELRHRLSTAKEKEALRIINAMDPPCESGRGRPRMPAENALRATLYIARTGVPWRDLPKERFGCWQTVYGWFRKWLAMGVFEAISGLRQGKAAFAYGQTCSIDSTACKAHKSAFGARKGSPGPIGQCISAGRGGSGTKIHVVSCDGRPIAYALSGAASSDAGQAAALAVQPEYMGMFLNADRAYLSELLRAAVHDRSGILNVPAKSNTLKPIEHDPEIYKLRSEAEMLFGRIKEFRRVATRYDKLARVFEGFFLLSCVYYF
ncbi:MAG: IS5 family transposase [Eubacteriaceae bacterium]|jgi:transposase|nr:IS5 family transposase [Eubacteriaceae bacterium]